MPRLLHHISARYPAGVGAGAQKRIESLTLSSGASRTAHFLQNAARGACLSPKIQYAGTLGC